MNKYKSDDYKLSAVKYYLNHNDSMDKVCEIFDCKKSTLKWWIDRYKTTKNITRKNRKPISYKINKEQVKTALNMIDNNEQLTMDELLFYMKQKYNKLDITQDVIIWYVLNVSNDVCMATRQDNPYSHILI